MNERDAQARVVIAGGGVAALEATLALRALSQEPLSIELIALERDFVYPAAGRCRSVSRW